MPYTNTDQDLERNKAISQRFNDEVKNKHQLHVLDELLSPDFVNHSEIPSFPSNRDGVKAFFTYWVQAFPDLTCIVKARVAEGNLVIDYFSLEGTHQGEFMGIPATGRRVKYEGMHIFAFANGQISAHWNVLDTLTMMMQLGVIPTMNA